MSTAPAINWDIYFDEAVELLGQFVRIGDRENLVFKIRDERNRRQDIEPQYLETGAVYVMRAQGFQTAKHRFFGKTVVIKYGGHAMVDDGLKRADYVEIYELEEQKRKPRSVDDDLIATVKQNVKDAASSLRLGILPPKPLEERCSGCDFKMLCSQGCRFAAKAGGKTA